MKKIGIYHWHTCRPSKTLVDLYPHGDELVGNLGDVVSDIVGMGFEIMTRNMGEITFVFVNNLGKKFSQS